MTDAAQAESPPSDAGARQEFSDGRDVVIRAPYASIARSMFFEAMWPTRKAMPSRSTSLIMVHSVTRRSAYSGVISGGGFIRVRLPLSALDASGSPQVGPERAGRANGAPRRGAPTRRPGRMRSPQDAGPKAMAVVAELSAVAWPPPLIVSVTVLVAVEITEMEFSSPTYTVDPEGVIVTEYGSAPAATTPSTRPEAALTCHSVPASGLVTYSVEPSGETAIPCGSDESRMIRITLDVAVLIT